jgi:transposase-like protein
MQTRSFKGRQFTAEVILWALRWHWMFPVSYRDLELMLADRGIAVDHTTIFRWAQGHRQLAGIWLAATDRGG